MRRTKTRKCRICGETDPANFYEGRPSTCKKCHSAIVNGQRQHGDGAAILRWRREREAAVGGRCEICGTSDRQNGRLLAVDHCHDTGKLRGLLCSNCNTVLGLAKEQPAILLRAAEYLREHAVRVGQEASA
jgi:RNase P subunit RPR2